jgi:hypothetical protein
LIERELNERNKTKSKCSNNLAMWQTVLRRLQKIEEMFIMLSSKEWIWCMLPDVIISRAELHQYQNYVSWQTRDLFRHQCS